MCVNDLGVIDRLCLHNSVGVVGPMRTPLVIPRTALSPSLLHVYVGGYSQQ